ncbi:MAG: D-aminoacyl-tRNA deacylase [Halobacteria archaeon]
MESASGAATIAILCSTADPASLNIAERLREAGGWKREAPGVESRPGLLLAVRETPLLQMDGADRELKEAGFRFDALVFASRHVSRAGRACYALHFPGNVGEAPFGGRERQLAAAAPGHLKALAFALRASGREVAIECTHHGPTGISTPCLFAEIGCTEAEWRDPEWARPLARALLNLEPASGRTLVGFGGGHYVPRPARLLFETPLLFGHMFSSYQIPDLDGDRVAEALRLSGTREALADRKGTTSEERKKLRALVESAGGMMVREAELRAAPD